jgi:hypothetical protein
MENARPDAGFVCPVLKFQLVLSVLDPCFIRGSICPSLAPPAYTQSIE